MNRVETAWDRWHDVALKAANHRWAVPVVLACTFLNSSIFPVPQDVFILPLLVIRPGIAWWLMTLCVIASTLGGVVGYFIGYTLYDAIGAYILKAYGYDDALVQVQTMFGDIGWLMVIVSAVTPFPYKIITISSGFLQYDLFSFVLFSVLGRMIRFYAYAVLFHIFRDRIESIVRRWFPVFMIVGLSIGLSLILWMAWNLAR